MVSAWVTSSVNVVISRARALEHTAKKTGSLGTAGVTGLKSPAIPRGDPGALAHVQRLKAREVRKVCAPEFAPMRNVRRRVSSSCQRAAATTFSTRGLPRAVE